MSDIDAKGANFEDADLREANLESAILCDANLEKIILPNANLAYVDFSNASLQEADLQGADLTNSSFVNVDFRNVKLSNANFFCAELEGANFENVDLREVNLENSILINANLRGSNLCNVNLSSADLKGANFENADLRGADLDGVRYDETTQFPEDIHPSSYKGLWLDEDTFVKYDCIDRIRIAKSWDRFSDLMLDMGFGEEVSKMVKTVDDDSTDDWFDDSNDDCYSYRHDIEFKDVNIRLSDLQDLDWDYVVIKSSTSLDGYDFGYLSSAIKEAVESGDIELEIYLYT